MIEAAIKTRLSEDAAITALVGNRIHPVKLPQNCGMPAIRFQRVATATEHTHQGGAGIVGPLFQVSIFSKSALEAAQIAELVRLSLDGFKGVVGDVVIHSAQLRNQHETFEDEVDVYHRPMDFEVWHRESRP